MPTIELPINPEVLIWARMEAGLVPEEAAGISRISVEEIASYEDGSAKPNITKLDSLARAYKKAYSVLLLPEAPALTRPEDFRTIGGSTPRVTRELATGLNDARRWASTASYLSDELDIRTVTTIPSFTSTVSPEEAASQSFDPDVSLDPLRENVHNAWISRRISVEQRNVLVFTFTTDESDARAFSRYAEFGYSYLAVNTKGSPQARSFSLFHELGHIALRGSGVCLEKDGSGRGSVESWCNRFSAAVLMPAGIVVRDFRSRNLVGLDPVVAAQQLASRYRVTLDVACLRGERLELLPEGTYDQIVESRDETTGDGTVDRGGGGQFYPTYYSQHGRLMVDLVRQAHQRQLIDRPTAARLLEVKSPTAVRLMAGVLAGR